MKTLSLAMALLLLTFSMNAHSVNSRMREFIACEVKDTMVFDSFQQEVTVIAYTSRFEFPDNTCTHAVIPSNLACEDSFNKDVSDEVKSCFSSSIILDKEIELTSAKNLVYYSKLERVDNEFCNSLEIEREKIISVNCSEVTPIKKERTIREISQMRRIQNTLDSYSQTGGSEIVQNSRKVSGRSPAVISGEDSLGSIKR